MATTEVRPVRILVPLDGSWESEKILPTLVPLMRVLPAEVTLFRAVERGGDRSEAIRYLAKVAGDLKVEGVTSRCNVSPCEVADQILGSLQSGAFDLLALTTHARTGFERTVMGSVADSLLRRSPVPLLVNRPNTRVGDWKRVVLPLSDPGNSEIIVSEVIPLAQRLEATVHVISVFREESRSVEEEGPPGSVRREACDRIAAEGVLAVSGRLQGDPAEEIASYARRVGAGMIFMGAQERTGVSRVALGSTTERLLRATPCPVLVRGAAAPATPSRGKLAGPSTTP